MPASTRPDRCITPKRRTASRHSRLSPLIARASVESRGSFSGRSSPRSFSQGGRGPGGNSRPILESIPQSHLPIIPFRGAWPSHPRKVVVHRHYVELLRLKASHRAIEGRWPSSPTYVVFMLFVAGFENDLKELLISWHPSDVLRRTVALAGKADWTDQ